MASLINLYDSISTLLTSCITLKNEDKTIIVNAIWDTGATNSCISRKAIEIGKARNPINFSLWVIH